MNNTNLPQSITVGRFLDALTLQNLGGTNSLEQTICLLPIQTIHFIESKTFTLPFTGETITLEPTDNGCISLSMWISTEKFSLLFLPRDPISWPVLCEKATDWLERELGRILMASECYSQMIAEHLTRGDGFSFLTNLQEIFDCDIFLINKQLEVLGWAGGRTLPFAPIAFKPPAILQTSLNLPKPFTPLYIGQWSEKKHQYTPLTWCPLYGPNGVLGFLGLVDTIQAIGSVKQFFLQKTMTLIALELVKAQCLQDSERQHHRDFLFDLLYNNFDSVEVIISRGKLWGWDFTKPHLVVVGEIIGYDPNSTDRERLEGILAEISTFLPKCQPKTICIERNGQAVFLFPLQNMIPQSEWHSKALELLEPIINIINSILGKKAFRYGLGNLYNSARYLHRSFQEARTALELGQLFDYSDRLISFQDLGIMRLLHRLDHQELEDYRSEVLGPLLKFDKESNLALEETLLAYFSCNTDLNTAGEKLYLHPNTLRYRLKKASEILGRDLSSLDNQINLFLALKIGRLKALWPD